MAELEIEEEETGKGPDWHLVISLLAYLRPYKWYIAASLALTMLSAPLVLSAPPLTKAAIDVFIAPDESRPLGGFELLLKRVADAVGFGETKYQGVGFIGLAFLTASLVGLLMQYLQGRLTGTLGQNLMYDLREDIFRQTQELEISFYDRTPVGRLMTRLTNDVNVLNDIFTTGVITVLCNAISLVYIVVWMLIVNWRLSLVAFLVLPLLAIITASLQAGAMRAFRKVRIHTARINSFLHERLSGMHIVQLFNREAVEALRFQRINEAQRRANVRTIFFGAMGHSLFYTTQAAGIALIIWYGGRNIIQELASIGTLVAFIQLTEAFYDPMLEISEQYYVFQGALAAFERIFKLLHEPGTARVSAKPRAIGRIRGKIEFRDVWFAYNDEEWILRGVSFTVQPGERIAFAGHTGAGKTTITNLLMRFYDVQRGAILLDDIDIRDVDVTMLRSAFSIVLQDVFLFAGDLASNIKLGNEAISQEAVEAAARDVHADTFISRLRNGYRTEIGPRGSQLSVGQKQLIGFSRALAFNRPVLILDEATSSVDSETEALIHDAVQRLMAGRTSLIIAHHLLTIQSVDRIIVMHKGEICEAGDHQSLLALRGLYWKLYRLQFERELKGGVAESAAP
jgi:ATP-binding cassette, subfamily B, multidrug efflux pump